MLRMIRIYLMILKCFSRCYKNRIFQFTSQHKLSLKVQNFQFKKSVSIFISKLPKDSFRLFNFVDSLTEKQRSSKDRNKLDKFKLKIDYPFNSNFCADFEFSDI